MKRHFHEAMLMEILKINPYFTDINYSHDCDDYELVKTQIKQIGKVKCNNNDNPFRSNRINNNKYYQTRNYNQQYTKEINTN